MDLILPDGTPLRNVPEGMTREELIEKLQRNGYDTVKLGLMTREQEAYAKRGKAAAEQGGVKLPTFSQSYDEELANRGMLEKFNASIGIDRPAYGLKSLMFPLSRDEQQRFDASKQLEQTLPGIAGTVVRDAMALGPAYGRIFAGAGGSAPIDVGARILSAGGLGALQGGLMSPGERAKGAEAGATGAMLGAVGGEMIGGAFAKRAAKNVQLKEANAMLDSAAKDARSAGYKLPPSQTNPTVTNKVVEGVSGIAATEKRFSDINEKVTQNLASRALGIKHVTPANLAALRSDAGRSYDTIKNYGMFEVDDDFVRQMADLGAENQKAAQVLPELLNPKVQAMAKHAETLGGQQIPSDATISAIRQLRQEASKNIVSEKAKTQALGWGQKRAAAAMEDLIDRNLTKAGKKEILANFRDARKTFAKSYAVEEAIKNGRVSAQELAKQLQRGEPLDGELLTIAKTADQFPKALQNMKGQSALPFSPLDYAFGVIGTGGGFLGGGPVGMAIGAAAPLVRPALRETLRSPVGQAMGVPSYPVNAPNVGVLPAAGAALMEK